MNASRQVELLKRRLTEMTNHTDGGSNSEEYKNIVEHIEGLWRRQEEMYCL